MNAAGIARQLDAVRQGNNWRTPCPLGCGYALSLSEGEDGRLLAHCFGGCEFDQILSSLVEFGLLDDDDADLEPPPRLADHDDADRRRKIELAREIYASGAPDERIAVYLRSRGLKSGSDILRFTEAAPHRLGARLPAMLAPIVDVDGEQIGTHLTYLRRDGCGKANLPKVFQRETHGALVGGAIRLIPFDPDVALIVAEGIETALAAAEIFGAPAWSAIYAEGLKTVELPIAARRVLIAADRDKAGRQCALAARDRWVAEGREVAVKVPLIDGQDFADVLFARRRNA
jgi:hypothetical protein